LRAIKLYFISEFQELQANFTWFI